MLNCKDKGYLFLSSATIVVMFALMLFVIAFASEREADAREVIATASDDSSGDSISEASYISENTQPISEDSSSETGTDDVSDTVSEPEPEPEPPTYVFEYKGNISNIREETLRNLEECILSQKDKISVFYQNLDTGLTITYRADAAYTSASVIKAPYVKHILTQDIDLDEVVVTRHAVRGYAAGTRFTVKELIKFAIVYSDNQAYYELVRNFGTEGFNQMSEELGITCSITNSYNFSQMTAREAGTYFKDIYRYALISESGALLIDHMLSCDYNQQIGKELGHLYPVAHKYGANPKASRMAFHSAAVVYAPFPYVLTVFTSLYPKQSNTPVFTEIALAIDAINAQIDVPVNSIKSKTEMLPE